MTEDEKKDYFKQCLQNADGILTLVLSDGQVNIFSSFGSTEVTLDMLMTAYQIMLGKLDPDETSAYFQGEGIGIDEFEAEKEVKELLKRIDKKLH